MHPDSRLLTVDYYLKKLIPVSIHNIMRVELEKTATYSFSPVDEYDAVQKGNCNGCFPAGFTRCTAIKAEQTVCCDAAPGI